MPKYMNHINVNVKDTGERHYTSAIPDGYSPDLIQYTYTAQVGDRWDILAYRFLGSASYWYVLARANGGADGSLFVEPGTQVIIPEVI